MNIPMMILCLGALVSGLGLLQFEFRKSAAIVLGLAIGGFLAILPWPIVDLLFRENQHFRQWAAPRMSALHWGWYIGSYVFGLTVGLCVAFLNRRKDGRDPKWDVPRNEGNSDAALLKILTRPPTEEGTLLGFSKGKRKVFLRDEARERHMQIVGPTRSGKSQLLLALSAQDMNRGMPVFFMEAKGDSSDFDQFLKIADLAGRTGHVRYFNPQDHRSMTFNPIRPLPGQDSVAITNQIARAIGREPTSKGEGQDYYRSVDYSRLLTMVQVFLGTGLEFTLKDCYYYFVSEKARRKVFRLSHDRRTVAMAVEDFTKNKDFAALTSLIQPWISGNLGRLLNSYTPQIKLEEIFDQDQLAYFAIPIGHLHMFANPLGRMVISGLLSVAASRQKSKMKPKAASVILDEFAEFATPVFSSFIASVGSAKFWTVLSHQDMGQLKKVEGTDAEGFRSSIFTNTSGCKVCFRTPDPADAEFWSKTLGTYETFKDTERIQTGIFGTKKTGELSRRMVDEFKIHPNLLKNLSPGTALIYSPGHEDCLARTARVSTVVEHNELPELDTGEQSAGTGLNLESEAPVGESYTDKGDSVK